MNLAQYLPVLLFILVGAASGAAILGIGSVLKPHRPDASKNAPYECGLDTTENARMKFDVRFYPVAILFVLFNLAIVFLFPWALAFKDVGAAGFGAALLFLAILAVGFVYGWKKGALEWE